MVGYALLWLNPKVGATILLLQMAGAIHVHLVAMKETPDKIVLQIILCVALVAVLLLTEEKKEEEKEEQKD